MTRLGTQRSAGTFGVFQANQSDEELARIARCLVHYPVVNHKQNQKRVRIYQEK